MQKFAKWFLLLCIAAVAGVSIGAGYWFASRALNGTSESTATSTTPSSADDTASRTAMTVPKMEEPADNTAASSIGAPIAFFYQYVGPFTNGGGQNAVRVGRSEDGLQVDSYANSDVLTWASGMNTSGTAAYNYGDAAFSFLSNGHWAMTAWSSPEDPRGGSGILYYEAACPAVLDDTKPVVIQASSGAACEPMKGLGMAKTSQIFTVGSDSYLFHMVGGSVYLAHVGTAQKNMGDLANDGLCMRSTPVSSLSQLAYGESTLVMSSKTNGILAGDVAFARRADGTWVLFFKGIDKEKNDSCETTSLCELCARGVYRSTSSDLVNWSKPERVVSQASVPDATTMPDGSVWLYWQDFSQTCESQDRQLGAIAPIKAAYELPGTYELSEPQAVSFPDESFETNKKMHYATNPNPVVADDAALDSLDACFAN